MPADGTQQQADEAAAEDRQNQPEIRVLQGQGEIGRVDGLDQQAQEQHHREPGEPGANVSPEAAPHGDLPSPADNPSVPFGPRESPERLGHPQWVYRCHPIAGAGVRLCQADTAATPRPTQYLVQIGSADTRYSVVDGGCGARPERSARERATWYWRNIRRWRRCGRATHPLSPSPMALRFRTSSPSSCSCAPTPAGTPNRVAGKTGKRPS